MMRILFLLLMPLLLTACAELFSAPPLALVGTTWRVVELQGEPFTAPADEAFTLRLGPDGHIQAYAGCSRLTGLYQLEEERAAEGRLRVGPFDLLEALCAPEVSALERKVIHAMEGGSRYWRPDARELSLRNPIGITLIRFRAEP